MKKFLSLVLVALIVSAVQAAPSFSTIPTNSRRQEMVQRYVSKHSLESRFWEAVDKGDIAFIDQLEDAVLLTKTDKFGNNCFHRAKNAATVQALSAAIRRIYKEQAPGILHGLINQKNKTMNETPAQAHLSVGKTDTFALLFASEKGTLQASSDLAVAISKLRPTMHLTGPIAISTTLEKERIRSLSQDKAGRTIAQVALANANQPGMDNVIRYFQANAPYLF